MVLLVKVRLLLLAQLLIFIIHDIDPLRSTHNLDDVLKCDFVFICVPTPMNSDGSQNKTFIESVFEKSKKGPIYIIKSTIQPGTTNEIAV